VAKLADAQP